MAEPTLEDLKDNAFCAYRFGRYEYDPKPRRFSRLLAKAKSEEEVLKLCGEYGVQLGSSDADQRRGNRVVLYAANTKDTLERLLQVRPTWINGRKPLYLFQESDGAWVVADEPREEITHEAST